MEPQVTINLKEYNRLLSLETKIDSIKKKCEDEYEKNMEELVTSGAFIRACGEYRPLHSHDHYPNKFILKGIYVSSDYFKVYNAIDEMNRYKNENIKLKFQLAALNRVNEELKARKWWKIWKKN